jgi:hypothetical protein
VSKPLVEIGFTLGDVGEVSGRVGEGFGEGDGETDGDGKRVGAGVGGSGVAAVATTGISGEGCEEIL